jgi:hypothetical protein
MRTRDSSAEMSNHFIAMSEWQGNQFQFMNLRKIAGNCGFEFDYVKLGGPNGNRTLEEVTRVRRPSTELVIGN